MPPQLGHSELLPKRPQRNGSVACHLVHATSQPDFCNRHIAVEEKSQHISNTVAQAGRVACVLLISGKRRDLENEFHELTAGIMILQGG